MAVAVFGAILITIFNHSLDQQLDQLKLSAELNAKVNEARPQLAAVKVADARIQSAIASSFVSGYRAVVWVATGLELLGSLIAWLMIGREKLDQEPLVEQ